MEVLKNVIAEPSLLLRRFTFSPIAGPVGTLVTLSGNALSSPVAQVLFNGTPANYQVSGVNIVASVPAGAIDGPIKLIFPDGSSVSSLTSFDVTSGVSLPKINSFFPTSGPAGTLVQLNGMGFSGLQFVRFGGVVAAQFSVQSDTNVIVTVPQGAVDGFISVERDGVSSLSPTPFDVTTGTLSINGISPMSGGAGTQVSVIGNGFTGVDTVLFGGLAASFFTQSDGLIIAFAPPAIAGTSVSITVKKGVMSANSGSLQFSYAANTALSIASFSPTSGPEGTPIQLIGTGFIGVEATSIGGWAAPFTIQSDSSMTVWVPGGAMDGKIGVTEAGVTAFSAAIFDVTAGIPFAISGLNPPLGAPGTEVTISGSGFTGVDTVLFGNLAASFSVVTDNRIVAVAPNGVPGTSVTVTLRKAAQQTVSTPLVYNYPGIGGGRPSIASLTPNPVSAGQTVRVLGSGFTGTTMVKIGLSRIAFTFFNDGELRIVPNLLTPSGRVSVTTPGGTATSAQTLVVQ